MRLIVLFIAVLVFVLAIRNLFGKPRQAKNSRLSGKTENMVPCEFCKLHLPQKDAIADGKHFFCSREHLQQWHRSSEEEQ